MGFDVQFAERSFYFCRVLCNNLCVGSCGILFMCFIWNAFLTFDMVFYYRISRGFQFLNKYWFLSFFLGSVRRLQCKCIIFRWFSIMIMLLSVNFFLFLSECGFLGRFKEKINLKELIFNVLQKIYSSLRGHP